nr:biotin/lipoyl-binding protein [Alistipes sp.]
MRKTLSLLILLFAVGCSSKVTDKPQPRPVKVVTVSALTTVEREFAALTTADDAVNLAFKLSGRVVDIPVAKGQFVKRGEVLAELDSRDVELQVSASKAAYTEAQSRLERARRLLQHDAISLQEVESLES